jgi:hypothetical protein
MGITSTRWSLLEGETLDQRIKWEGPLPVALAIDIVDQVAAAVEQNLIAREQGV